MSNIDRSNKRRKALPGLRNKCRNGNYDQTKTPREKAKRRPSGVQHIPWTDQEIQLLFNNPPHGMSDRELSGILCRSVGSIQTMRSKFKKDIND